jgi:hypothetical protein
MKKEGIMKGLLLLCIVLALLISSPVQSQTLYDDFTGPLLDSGKWLGDYKWVSSLNHLEIGQVIAKKKLDMFNHCLGSTEDGDADTQTCSTRLAMQDGVGVTAMEALVQLIAITLEQSQCLANDDGVTWIRFGGAFFNSTAITGTVTSQLNDVQAFIALRRNAISTDPAGVMTIEGRVVRCTNDDCTTSVPVTTDPPGNNPLILGTVSVKKKVQLRMVYDPTNHRFLFKQGKKDPEVEMVYAPRENHPPFAQNGGFKRLEVRHHLANCSAGATSGWARAYFDNFYITREP